MNESVKTWKRILSEKMADCRVFEVYRDVCVDAETDESESTFYRLDCPDWCNVIALTGDNQVILIEQFRQGTQTISLEIPGGMVDEGENPAESAARELLEETGYAAGEVVALGTAHPNPALQNNRIHMFVAKNCEKQREPHFDTTEHCVTRVVPLSEIQNLIENGDITHSLVLNGFLRFHLRRDEFVTVS